jgi:ABC-2 type transport system permease protein
MSSGYIAIGLFTSSLTNNQIVAFLIALVIGLCFHLMFDAIAANLTGWLGELFQMLSVRRHFESISRGVIDSKDVIFFLSLTLLGLLFAETMMSKRK